MQSQPHYSLLRRILFPYSGKEPLTHIQGLVVIVSWGVFFALILSFCSFPLALAMLLRTRGPHVVELFMLIAFLSGAVIFGMLGWLVVAMNNRAARTIQQRNASQSSTNGGRHGP